jgi:hypothetical protein
LTLTTTYIPLPAINLTRSQCGDCNGYFSKKDTDSNEVGEGQGDSQKTDRDRDTDSNEVYGKIGRQIDRDTD